jgi:hypothetical protein
MANAPDDRAGSAAPVRYCKSAADLRDGDLMRAVAYRGGRLVPGDPGSTSSIRAPFLA